MLYRGHVVSYSLNSPALRLWVAIIDQNPLKITEMDAATQKILEMAYHVCLCQIIIFQPSLRPHLVYDGLRFQKCPTSTLV